MRALIIDDDPTIREMLDLVLTLEGFEVDLASDGVQGVAAAGCGSSLILCLVTPRSFAGAAHQASARDGPRRPFEPPDPSK